MSGTGNIDFGPAFWSLKTLKSIDVENLRSDRLQLWGEAA